MNSIPEVDHTREATLKFFLDYTERNQDLLRGRKVCDLSAGRGYIAYLFENAGAAVHAGRG